MQVQPRPRHPRHTHHEVPTQHQGHNLRLRWRVAVVVTRQVSAAPPARPTTWLPIVAWAEHAVQAEQQQHKHNAGGQAERRHPALRGRWSGVPRSTPPATPPSRALLVQGDVSVGLCHTWPLGDGLPESTRPGLWRRPGTSAVLRVPPFQGLPWVQAECHWDDRQQADVPRARQWAASARMPSKGSLLLLFPYCPHRTPLNLPDSNPSRAVPWMGGESTGGPSPPSSGTSTLLPHRLQHPSSHHCSAGPKHRVQNSGFPTQGEKECFGDGELTPPGREVATRTPQLTSWPV